MIYIVGNWKMNKTRGEAMMFMDKIISSSSHHLNCSVSIAPPLIHIPIIYDLFNPFSLVSQNVSSEENGAYTGEVSASMLAEYVESVIIGHSERRKCFNETDSVLSKKLSLCFRHKLRPIFCFGENTEDRKSGEYLSIIKTQLKDTIMSLSTDDLFNTMLAYEPVWAIGTGKNANPNQIEEVHNYVRDMIIQKTGKEKGSQIPILYGGSCT